MYKVPSGYEEDFLKHIHRVYLFFYHSVLRPANTEKVPRIKQVKNVIKQNKIVFLEISSAKIDS